MFVQDTDPKKNSSSYAYLTWTPLNYVLKLFGLFCVSYDGRKLKYSWPKWQISFICILFFTINSVSIYFSLRTTKSKPKAKFQDYFPIIYLFGFAQYIVNLILVYKYGRQLSLNYYNVYDSIDHVIGRPYCNEIRRNINKTCIFFIVIGSLYLITDCSALVMAYGWYISTIHSIDYIYTVIKMFSSLDCISHLIQTKYRFKRMKDILTEYYSNIGSLPGVTKDVISKKGWNKTASINTPIINTVTYKQPNVILSLGKCYLLMLEQCEYINDMFGFRILLGGLVYLMEMVMLINFMIRLITGALIPYYKVSWFPLISTAMKIVNYSSILICGINSCEQNYKQTDGIIRCIDHLLTNKKLTMEVEEALKELRELIITRPVTFTAVNFYTLDYPAMLSLASAVVTYTIILLQNMQ